ncbi:hypothetical protein VTP01DRAFT_5913 [Rhizomucor pusillus]|uniref:uncharacterized protein n=1 Tax=Rhizomucor pusillus TaxID=4840 RepID=UPI003742E2C3
MSPFHPFRDEDEVVPLLRLWDCSSDTTRRLIKHYTGVMILRYGYGQLSRIELEFGRARALTECLGLGPSSNGQGYWPEW